MVESSPENWRRADEFLSDVLVGHDPDLEAALAAQNEAGLPPIEVAPVSGKLLSLLTRISGARRVLEIGTLGGYSTIWLARAVGDGGEVVTIEAEPGNAAIARESIDAADLGERVAIRIGRAADVLPTLEGSEPFDLVFIDADKESNTVYLDWAARLGRPGTVVILDNIGREGEIVREDTTDSKVIGTREALQMLADDPRFDATALQTVGVKGWDGVALAVIV
ncbi:putative O-methyltransferase YrrM [Microbacterium ginsengiterrae]|uniref:Putative O-methyltransferase YrrM n=1 Tax=Microbacterium ginsengiterrae TaxID=546115 RepID=A0A7W9CDG8_9MICO|nr:O-methyltransferase [Microbacterium ginsengiterrae]MBB5743588.1 putative O-methyltransferase YrrM [Microbacterium ginsengiterrae]